MSNFQSLKVVGRSSETQLQVAENLNKLEVSVYHVKHPRRPPPLYFSNKSYTLNIILQDNQFVHVIIK